MNIQMQAAGLFIMLILLYFSLRQQMVGLYSETMFLRVLSVTILCVCLDIASVVAIVYEDRIPRLVLEFICKSYVVSLVWVGFFGLVYTCLDIYAKDRYKKILYGYAAVVLGASVLIYLLPIHYYYDGEAVYTYGPSDIATYFFAVLFVLITLYQVIRHGDQMNPKRRSAVRTWMIVWIIAAATQFFNSRLLLVGYATALGMMILFFELENPEANLDRETGAFNSHALLEYMRQEYEKDHTFAVLLISLGQYQSSGFAIRQVEFVLRWIVKYLQSISGIKVFKNVERELVVVCPDEETLEHALEKIKERFEGAWNIEEDGKGGTVTLEPVYLIMPDSTVARGAEEVFHLFKYFKVENDKMGKDNTIRIDREMVRENRDREDMQERILAALAEDRIEVFYQPIYSTKKKCFVSAEALVRIRCEDGSILPPGKFIPVAEQTGLISQLGETVFEKTCRFIKEQNPRQYGIEYIEVNLSVRQCETRDLAKTYIQIIQKYGVDPAMINLEITETASILARKILVENMQILIRQGVSFSLDDFGNGQSNLNYIVDMPVSIVKFDRDMSQAYFENKKAKFVMEAAMQMIHDMKLKIVSEGIETREQMETITELGIDYIQGYYFSKPIPEKEFLKFIRERNAF